MQTTVLPMVEPEWLIANKYAGTILAPESASKFSSSYRMLFEASRARLRWTQALALRLRLHPESIWVHHAAQHSRAAIRIVEIVRIASRAESL